MKRECVIIDYSDTLNRHLCVDKKDAKRILTFLKSHRNGFKNIRDRIMEQKNPYFTNFVKLSYGYTNISEMRFNVGGSNGRIYCKEILNNYGQLCVVMSRLWDKKTSEGINKKIKSVLESIRTYEYEIDYAEK